MTDRPTKKAKLMTVFNPAGPPPFSTVGLFTYLRTYARRHDDEDPNSTIESWDECITRVVLASNLQLNVGFTEDELKELFSLLYNLKCSVAGRFLWQLGTKTIDKTGLLSLQNCAFVTVDDPVVPFTWVMNFLMLGAGCGYRVLPEDVAKIPPVKYALITRKETNDADYIVPDSREGWIKLLGRVLKAHFYSGKSFNYSCILLRSKGAPIKGFGGLASGPEVLCNGINGISKILNARAGMKLRPIDALDIMNIIGQVVVSGNVRRCLPKGAMVHTDKGLVPIEDIKVGDMALTTDGYRKVTNTFDQGVQELVEIKTQDGTFRCTPNHKMAVMVTPTTCMWKQASKLSAGDRLASTRVATTGIKTHLPTYSYTPPLHSTTCKNIAVPNLDEDMAWLIGMFQGDGYTYANRDKNGFNAYISIVFGMDEYDMAEKAVEQLQRFGENLRITLKKRRNENSYMVHCQSKQLAWYFDDNVKKPNTPIRVPEYILSAEPSIRLAYIAGVTDADGCLINRPIQVLSTVYEIFARDIQNLLYSCGIESRLKICSEEYPSRVGWQKLHRVNLITLRSQKEFSQIPELMKTMRNNSKSQKANGFPVSMIKNRAPFGPYGVYSAKSINVDSYCIVQGDISLCPVEVFSVEKQEGQEQTYDIEVEEMHEFFCNGYLTHNSAQICLGDCKDQEYLRAKRWDLGNVPNYRCYSNNSVICNDINEVLENEEFWQGYQGNGEPYGLINLKLSRSCGRLGETQYPDPDVQGYNPCVTGDTWVLTSEGGRQVSDLVGKGRVDVMVDGRWYPTTDKGFFRTGYQKVYLLKTVEGYEVKTTANHKFFTSQKEWVELKDLVPGQKLTMHDHSLLMETCVDDTDYKKGFKLGASSRGTSVFPSNMEKSSIAYSKGFVRGFKTGCGKSYYCTNKHILKSIQRLMARVGTHTIIGGNTIYISDDYKPISIIESITELDSEDVYDCTVPATSAFDANGFYVHNCAEQSLNNFESCCLSELYLPNIKTKEELFKCATYMYRVSKHSLSLPCPDSKDTEEVVHRNMRMGIGVTGYLQATEEQKSWLSPCYEYLREYDKKYSLQHGFPPSIKLCTVKPSGTLSLIGGVTSGVHPGYARYYIRRIRIASESPLVEVAKKHGYHCEYVRNFDQTIDPTTMVLSFPYELPEHTIIAENCTAIQQLEYVKRLQTEWSDNSVSCTVYYRKEELPEIKEWLKEHYNNSIKSVSFLLHSEHGFQQAPLEKISKEEYDEMVRNTRPITDVSGICHSKEDEKFIGEQECAGGACPIK